MAPYYYEVSDYSEFPEKIVSALTEHQSGKNDFAKLREHFSINSTTPVFVERLARLFHAKGLQFEADHLSCSNLDIRLGRHHGIGSGQNTVSTPLCDFVAVLLNQREIWQRALKQPDPERELERLAPAMSRPSLLSRIFGRSHDVA